MLSSATVDPNKQKCSKVTVQSEERGLFSTWLGEVARCNPDALTTFNQLDTDEERVLYCTSLAKVDHFIVEPVYKRKDLELARLKRTEGNAAFQKKWYRQAALLYSVSAVKAPGGTAGEETLAYAFANRSACLYYLGEMRLALADIELALANNYPAILQHKLYERMAKCHLHLGQKDEARAALISGKKLVEHQKNMMEAKKYVAAVKALQELNQCLTSGQPVPGEAIEPVDPAELVMPQLKLGSSKAVKEMSSLLSVVHSPTAGRHVVAAKPILAGDTLLVEEPFASVLYPDKLGTNCSTCLVKLRAVVPCPDCAGVGFCSTACRDTARASFHRFECRYQDLVQGLGCSALAALALRIVTTHPLEYFTRQRHHLNADTLAVSSRKQPYLALFNMVSLNEQRWPEDCFNRAVMAVALLKILKAAGYFPQKSEPDTFTNDEIFVGSLLLHHLNVLQFNAHEIYEFCRGDTARIRPFKNNLIGVGVYPRASYFNHSCHPGTARINIGNKLVIKALHPLQKGEEVCDNYGPVYYFKARAQRQAELAARYWFHCACPACQDDWPLLGKSSEPAWRDAADTGRLDYLQSLYDCAADFLEHGQRSEAVDSLTECLTGLYQLLQPPLDLITRAEDKLRTCCNDMGTVVFSDIVLKSNPQERSKNLMIS